MANSRPLGVDESIQTRRGPPETATQAMRVQRETDFLKYVIVHTTKNLQWSFCKKFLRISVNNVTHRNTFRSVLFIYFICSIFTYESKNHFYQSTYIFGWVALRKPFFLEIENQPPAD